MNHKINLRFGIIALFILFAALSRLLPHPPNFTPLGGMALFGAAYFSKKYWAFLVPIIALWISDLVLNNVVYAAYQDGFTWFSSYMIWVYGAFVAMIGIGSLLVKKIRPVNIITGSFVVSLIFFLITNFGVWYADVTQMYASNITGLLAAYTAGLPFFLNTIVGDLFYSALLFGSYALVQRQYPAL
ncbi:MAG: DUF6580 family putative transport protein, partial [Bacteroidota bacterium]